MYRLIWVFAGHAGFIVGFVVLCLECFANAEYIVMRMKRWSYLHRHSLIWFFTECIFPEAPFSLDEAHVNISKAWVKDWILYKRWSGKPWKSGLCQCGGSGLGFYGPFNSIAEILDGWCLFLCMFAKFLLSSITHAHLVPLSPCPE